MGLSFRSSICHCSDHRSIRSVSSLWPAECLYPFVSTHGWEGIGYSFASSTTSIYNDIDKTMLSHYGMNFANGVYTMAYRIIDIATMRFRRCKAPHFLSSFGREERNSSDDAFDEPPAKERNSNRSPGGRHLFLAAPVILTLLDVNLQRACSHFAGFVRFPCSAACTSLLVLR